MNRYFQHPRHAGATVVDGGHTRFRLWAPSCDTVAVEVEGHAPAPMSRRKGGWYECVFPCGPGARYRYRVAPDLAVPDPASCYQPDDVHGPSMVVDPGAYDWQYPRWSGRPWHDVVIYELHVGLMGGYAGVVRDLPRIAALGVTAIELMPLSEIPGGRNWGYDGVFPYAPESAYGHPDGLKALVDAAHGLGLMVFLDVVYNHFGPDGNYLASYAAPFFRADLPTPWGAAIDFRQSAVRTFFEDNALYWLMEFRFDGLRLDAVQAIAERDWLRDLPARVRTRTEPGRHVHLIVENENNDAGLLRAGYRAQWNDDAHNALHVMLTGEGEGYYANFTPDPTAALARVLAEGFAFQGEISPVTDRPRGSPSGDLPSERFIIFLQNHDQIGNRALGERLNVLAPEPALRAAYGLVLLCPQIPMLFMGEEWGSRQPFLFFTSHTPGLGRIVRDGRRREFAAFSHFASEKTRDTIPDPNAPETFAASRLHDAERMAPDHAAWTAFIHHLLALRHRWIMPRLSGAHAIGAEVIGPRAVVARWRMGDGAVLGIALNLGDAPLAMPDAPRGRPLYILPMAETDGISGVLPACSVMVRLAEVPDE
ncbi:malto-oligosyltrehalose trehalohydrolase [Komagataeibacter swingsii]|uniref:Malto-oligosyltrehalose trehalohydrolase n=1 Tax=Komagataeibacter swingsii TaxID=215220 RepID=A0A2V4RSZ8_9PROT|nr:malto-oligosyltrehalose trehalohydrolase [Komagataeibacter swingsii]PYD70767.1 malto-oligosyltrehalose trehalohydrolase [Komagataeibacter swingsii]GBQ61914.1 malto-oligosyltrehalose trehalohydrolase [Komagataeibacter swingsii DSM 16373]